MQSTVLPLSQSVIAKERERENPLAVIHTAWNTWLPMRFIHYLFCSSDWSVQNTVEPVRFYQIGKAENPPENSFFSVRFVLKGLSHKNFKGLFRCMGKSLPNEELLIHVFVAHFSWILWFCIVITALFSTYIVNAKSKQIDHVNPRIL